MKLLWTAQKVVFKRSSSTNAYYYTPKFLYVKLIDPKGSVKFQQNRIMVTKFYFKPFFFNIINLQFVKKFILLLKIISYFVGRGYQPRRLFFIIRKLFDRFNNLERLVHYQIRRGRLPRPTIIKTICWENTIFRSVLIVIHFRIVYHFGAQVHHLYTQNGGADCPALHILYLNHYRA